jgi:hypothetical protein
MMNLPTGNLECAETTFRSSALEARRGEERKGRDGDDRADHGAEAEGRAFEEAVARQRSPAAIVASVADVDAPTCFVGGGGGWLPRPGWSTGRDPDAAERERDHGADPDRDPVANDQADEDDHEPDRERDRQQRGRWNV